MQCIPDMTQNHIPRSVLSLILLLATFATAHATIVRMEIAFGDDPNTKEIYIELFDTATEPSDPDCANDIVPNCTIDNFLRYIEEAGERRYDGTYIHLSIPGAITQGGGFSFIEEQGVVAIPTYPPIPDETSPDRQNLRGTIAMDKNGGPGTSTSQWFFNLADNPNLDDPDTQGGFTVFGKAIANSMLVIDSIAALPRAIVRVPPDGIGLTAPFTKTVLNSAGRNVADNTNLVQVSRAEVYTIPQDARLSLSERIQLDFGDVGPGVSKELEFSVANLGSKALSFSLQFIGADAASFSDPSNNCGDVAFGDSCTETLTFTPISVGQLGAQLEITSNDPDAPTVLVPVIAFASGDNDGVSDDIEAAGPNNGDANNDGTPDTLQDYVTSFPNVNDQYVSLVTSPGLEFTQVQTIGNPSPSNTPRSVGASTTLNFNQGFYAFNIENVDIGGTATVTMTLPAGSNQSTYFKYGQVPNQALQSWYLFDFDGTTGAEFRGNQVILHYVDGGRGDDDGEANGIIVDPGGPAELNQSGGSSGGGCSMLTTTKQPRFPVDFVLLLTGLFVLGALRLTRARVG